jgi:phytoene synthase
MPVPLPDLGYASPADLAACRAMLRRGSKTFFAASLLLPSWVREPACSLYAFCRLADDAVDMGGGKLDALVMLRDRLARAYAGDPWDEPVDRAFADVVERFAIPRELPEALLEGFAWDATGRRYPDLSALCAYAARVAGTVGAMMSLLMGARDPTVVARACDLGVAMQLSNIARDVGEDARMGRVYLPLDWLAEAGIDPDALLARPTWSTALGEVVRRLLRAADALYARADLGIARLPAGCRPGIYAARYLYAGIGHELERNGLDSITTRTVVPGRRKLALIGRALAAAPARRRWRAHPPLPETAFLVAAVARSPRPADSRLAGERSAWWDLDDQAGWVLDLFLRLDRRRATGEGPAGS